MPGLHQAPDVGRNCSDFMKVLVNLLWLFLLFSCSAGKVSTMPFRNYDLSAERLMPLTYSNSSRAFRVWVSPSTSVDTIFTITMHQDSSFGAYMQEIGHKYYGGKKFKAYYSISKIQLRSDVKHFFERLDSLDMFTLEDQENMELVLHQPLSIYVVEYKKGDQYAKFRFQANAPQGSLGRYRSVERLLRTEFGSGVTLK